MSNIEVRLPLVDGSLYDLHTYGESCRLAVETLFTNDCSPPPRHMVIEVKTKSGKKVQVYIPYDHESLSTVRIDGQDV